MAKMETGEYLIGTNPDRDKTGKGNAVKFIKIKNVIPAKESFEEDIEEELCYAFSRNHRIYKVDEKDFERPGLKNEKVEELKEKIKDKHRSYLGFDFGEVIPRDVNGFKDMVNEIYGEEMSDEFIDAGNLVFIGLEQDSGGGEDEFVRLAWLKKAPKEATSAMYDEVFDKNQFVKYMLRPIEEPKRLTVHYINNEGKKTSMAVNSQTEIKDMKEFLYQFNN